MDKNNGICRADGFFSKSETEVYLEVRIKNITALILCTSYRSRFGLDEATSTIAPTSSHLMKSPSSLYTEPIFVSLHKEHKI